MNGRTPSARYGLTLLIMTPPTAIGPHYNDRRGEGSGVIRLSGRSLR
jgi:hypothetical protein